MCILVCVGPIAIVRDPNKVVTLRGAASALNDVKIFTASGLPVYSPLYLHRSVSLCDICACLQLGHVAVNRSEKVKTLGWTESEILVVVYESANVET